MGGDGLGALAIAIFAIMSLMVGGGFLLMFLLGRVIARRSGARSGTITFVAMALGLAGAGVGVLAVIATFFESTWAPPPVITLNLPAGYAHKTFILLEDPAASASLTWRGNDLPFVGHKTVLEVPARGVLRVKELGPLAGRGDATVRWSDGRAALGVSAGPARAVKAETYMIFHRDESSPDEQAMVLDPAKLGAFIQSREALP